MFTDDAKTPLKAESPVFATTQWSVVLAAGEQQCEGAREALTRLCEVYWYPLYAYVRRRVEDAHEAKDLTQSFFGHLLEKQTIARADPARGRFRAFLLTSLKNFLSNEWNKLRAEQRGGGRPVFSLDFDAAESRFQIEPSHQLTADRIYERRWVMTLLDNVLESLRREYADSGKLSHFDQFQKALASEMTGEEYEQAGAALETSATGAKQAAYRMRKRYRALFREAVAQTVASDDDLDDEIGRLLSILSS
jgi:RNA polymerase sigma-70 factor (ECF subfamily)